MDLDLQKFKELLNAIHQGVLEEFLGRPEVSAQKILYDYHLELLTDGGYVKGIRFNTFPNDLTYGYSFPRLTEKGHNLEKALEDLSLIAKIKKLASKNKTALTLAFVEVVISATVGTVV